MRPPEMPSPGGQVRGEAGQQAEAHETPPKHSISPKPYQRRIAELIEIPAEIRDLPIWCAWKLVPKKGKPKPDKEPVSPITGRTKGWNKPGFCTNAEVAIHYAEGNAGMHGIGLVLFPEHGIIGGDLDQCRDLTTGEPSALARKILTTAKTYTEVSPGLEGFRFLAFGSFGGHTGNDKKRHIEFYEDGRFLTFTGMHLEDSPFSVEQRDLVELGKAYLPKKDEDETNNQNGTQMPGTATAALDHFKIPSHVRDWIIDGAEPGTRSERIYQCAKDLMRAGATDAEALDILSDPNHRISDAALERRSGDIQSAREWIWRYTIPKARAEVDAETPASPIIISTEVSREDARVILPPFVPELLALPHGLGRLQDFAHGRQKYPSRAMAAVTALVALSHFAQAHCTVASYGGLGLGEWYMALAPTGGGKQDARDTLTCLHQALADDYLANLNRSRVHFSAPASQQGLHKLLEADRAITILSDEFAEWLAHTHRDPHKQAALGFAMQVYSSALSTVAPPFAVTNDYSPVENPRMTVFATSTAERILETMTLSQADSGAYNRWLVLVAEQERIPKRYEGLVYDPEPEVLSLVRWIQALPPTKVQFDPAAWALFKRHDSEIIEPIKFEDPHLAGRLSEQAIKMAALIALSDRRLEIRDTDLRAAYAIRENLYHRTRRLASHYGAMDDQHATGVAVDQVLEVLKRKPEIYRSDIPKFSRQFRKLSVQEQRAVITAVLDIGAAVPHPDSKAKIRSAIYEG